MYTRQTQARQIQSQDGSVPANDPGGMSQGEATPK